MPTVLIVDDEEDIRELIAMNLRREGYQILEAATGLDALRIAKKKEPDAIILDLMLPEMDGFTVFSELQKDNRTSRMPVLMLTAKGGLEDRISGLSLGADDYMPKPFSPRELVLRIKGLLRRAARPDSSTSDIVSVGPFRVDKSHLKLHVEDREIDLTATEFKLLLLLIDATGVTVDRAELLQRVWGYSDQVQTRTLDTHVKRLREKLESHGNAIETVRGVGYRFALNDKLD